MRVFMTGATGFIGDRVARALLSEGRQVAALVRDPEKARPLKELGASIFVGDVRRPETVGAAAAGCDAAIHAAALVDVVSPDHRRIHDVNVQGTINVLQACRSQRIGRVVHLSSIAALGLKERGLADETTELTLPYTNAYQETKHKADVAAASFDSPEMPVIRINPSVVTGFPDPKTGAILRPFVRGRLFVMPRVSGVASYVDVDDLADGILLALDKGRGGERYLFTQVNWTFEELLDNLCALSGRRKPRIRIGRRALGAAAALEETWARLLRRRPRLSRRSVDSLTRHRAYSSAKAEAELGWQPMDYRQRLKETLRKYAEEAHGR